MVWPILFFLQISIGALIGGLTNELAIRMLFRPYKPLYIGKWRIPFTPGLIPKRHQELAFQMGQLVERFLITPDGIRNMLEKGEVEQEMTEWSLTKLDELVATDKTIEELLAGWGITLDDHLEEALKKNINDAIHSKLAEYSDTTLEELLPTEMKQQIEYKVGEVSPILLKRMGLFFSSAEGDAFIRQMLSQLSGRLGMLGGLASMLLADEKVVNKVKGSLIDAFENESFQIKLSFLIQQEVRTVYQKRVSDVVEWIGEQPIEQGIERIINQLVDFGRVKQMKPHDLVGDIWPSIRLKVPKMMKQLFHWGQSHLEQGLKKFNLTSIASKQVESFPVNMLEKMIVSITGKELKMITVLGALLGGLIGAIQGGLVIWLG